MTTDWMECGGCGAATIQSQPDGTFYDGQTETCEECGARNVISADEEEAWLGHWECKHGRDDETPCPDCDAENAARPSPSKGAGDDNGRKE